jgi:hypothetical protein
MEKALLIGAKIFYTRRCCWMKINPMEFYLDEDLMKRIKSLKGERNNKANS